MRECWPQNPANQFSEKTTLFLMVADLVLSCVFTIEMFIRIIAMEFVGKVSPATSRTHRFQ